MIDIKDAIEQSKNKQNISDGGSQCFDFGDVVLVKYTLPLKYVKDNHRARDCEERVMEGVNQKIQKGVNTPKHISVMRTIEGTDDVCYVLQEKCKGENCASMAKYGAPYDTVISDLNRVYSIPFEHYKKLISDGCMLYEMGYEAKNKNLFYDEKTGFWFIDFLDYDVEKSFDENNPIKLFKTLKYVIPKPRQVASSLKYNAELSPDQKLKKDLLEYSIEAKTILAIKSVIPNFEKYEKFYLFDRDASIKQYLMEQGVVQKDLFKLEEKDYPVYDELYEIVIDNIIDKITNKGEEFWSVEVNDIRNDSNLFCLMEMWKCHKDNSINESDYQDEYDYESDLRSQFTETMIRKIVKKLEESEKNENSTKFINDFYSKYEDHIKK